MWYDGNFGLGASISQLSEEESTGTRGDDVTMSVLPKIMAGSPEDSESESEWGQDHDHDGYVDGWGSQEDEEYFKTLAAEYGGNAGEDYMDSGSTNEQLEVELNGNYEDEKDEISESHSPSIFEEAEGGDWEEIEERGTESSDLSSEDDRPPSKRRRINKSSNEESSEDGQSFLATSTVSSHAKTLQSAVFRAQSTANLVNFEEEPCESSGDPESADSIDEEDSDHAHAFGDDMSDMEEDGQDNDVFVALGDDDVPTEAEGSGQNELDGPENARLMSTGDINEPFSVHGNGSPEMDDEDEEIALETLIRQLSQMGFNDLDINNAPGPFDQMSTSVMQAQPIFPGDNTQSQLEMAWREFDSFGVNQAKLLGVHAMQALRNILLGSSTDEA
ncbi:hypothetical protein FRB90_007804 [Tulasnella sp. 427]|nr:hypothetical protein FRB90_007804 [Tulasnella sp. 427]